MQTCGALFNSYLYDDNKGCLLRKGHEGRHISKIEYFKDAEYIEWEHDYECGCEGDDWCDCSIYVEISAAEAEIKIKSVNRADHQHHPYFPIEPSVSKKPAKEEIK